MLLCLYHYRVNCLSKLYTSITFEICTNLHLLLLFLICKTIFPFLNQNSRKESLGTSQFCLCIHILAVCNFSCSWRCWQTRRFIRNYMFTIIVWELINCRRMCSCYEDPAIPCTSLVSTIRTSMSNLDSHICCNIHYCQSIKCQSMKISSKELGESNSPK